jgi:alpha-glucosidase
MANQIPVLLSAGLGVIPFTTTDISGYCGDIKDYPAMAELYTRWLQLGAFNPLSRIHHEGNNAVEPWLFGAEAEKNAKAAIELKYTLLPYVYTYAREAHDLGLPVMRPMVMEFPMDTETYDLDAQFMFGEEILVAPVVKKSARTKNLYLPEGLWIDFNDKKTEYTGEQWLTVDAPLDIIPMFVRKGSIIPRMPVMNYTREHKVYPVTFEVFPAIEGEKAEFSLYEDDGENLGYLRGEYLRTPVSCATSAQGYEIEIGKREGSVYKIEGEREFIFRIYTDMLPKTVLLDGVKAKNGKFWTADKKEGICEFHIKDDGYKHNIKLVF